MVTSTTTEERAGYWRERIEGWRHSGQSQQSYCRANELSFVYWRRKLTEGGAPDQRRRLSAFVPVSRSHPAAPSGLSLVLGNGMELRGISSENLDVVAQLLRAVS